MAGKQAAAPHLREPAGARPGVASGADRVRQVNERVLVAVGVDVEDIDEVAGRLALAPAPAAGAAVKRGQPANR